MKIVLLLIAAFFSLHAIETSDRLFECTEIFKERKSELLVELERIDEQKQALQALKVATEELLKQKEAKLTQKEEVIAAQLNEISQKESNIKRMLEANEATLQELKSIKMDQVSQTFAKMKPAAAASILADMEQEDAIMILRSLKPNIVGKIFTKMDPKKASQLTTLLGK